MSFSVDAHNSFMFLFLSLLFSAGAKASPKLKASKGKGPWLCLLAWVCWIELQWLELIDSG